jgi:hypothetical protein
VCVAECAHEMRQQVQPHGVVCVCVCVFAGGGPGAPPCRCACVCARHIACAQAVESAQLPLHQVRRRLQAHSQACARVVCVCVCSQAAAALIEAPAATEEVRVCVRTLCQLCRVCARVAAAGATTWRGVCVCLQEAALLLYAQQGAAMAITEVRAHCASTVPAAFHVAQAAAAAAPPATLITAEVRASGAPGAPPPCVRVLADCA